MTPHFVPRVLIVLLGIWGLPLLAVTVYPADYEPVFAQVTKEGGAILDRESNLPLYELVEAVFKPLAEAQRRLLQRNDEIILHDVFLFQSDQPEAFIQMLHPRLNKKSHLVFISTILLEKAFEIRKLKAQSKPEDLLTLIDQGLMRLVGALAHELGHPFDVLSASSLHHDFGRLRAGQAIELRAHMDGIRILQEAGFPSEAINSIIELLQDIEKEKEQEQDLNHLNRITPVFYEREPVWQTVFGAAAKAASTHPTHEIALAAIRWYLLYERYGLALMPKSLPAYNTTAFLTRLTEGLRVRPKSLEQAQTNLTKSLAELSKTPDVSLAQSILDHVGGKSNEAQRLEDVERRFNIDLLEWFLWINRDPGLITTETSSLLQSVLDIVVDKNDAKKTDTTHLLFTKMKMKRKPKLWPKSELIKNLLLSEPELYRELEGQSVTELAHQSVLLKDIRISQTIVDQASVLEPNPHYLRWIQNPTMRALHLQKNLSESLKGLIKYNQAETLVKQKSFGLDDPKIVLTSTIIIDKLDANEIGHFFDNLEAHKFHYFHEVSPYLSPDDIFAVQTVTLKILEQAEREYTSHFDKTDRDYSMTNLINEMWEEIKFSLPRDQETTVPTEAASRLQNLIERYSGIMRLAELGGISNQHFVSLDSKKIRAQVLMELQSNSAFVLHSFAKQQTKTFTYRHKPTWVTQDFLNQAWVILNNRDLPDNIKASWKSIILNFDRDFFLRTITEELRRRLNSSPEELTTKVESMDKAVNKVGHELMYLLSEIITISKGSEDNILAPLSGGMGSKKQLATDKVRKRLWEEYPIHFFFRAIDGSNLSKTDKTKLMLDLFQSSTFPSALTALFEFYKNDKAQAYAALRQIYTLIRRHLTVEQASFLEVLERKSVVKAKSQKSSSTSRYIYQTLLISDEDALTVTAGGSLVDHSELIVAMSQVLTHELENNLARLQNPQERADYVLKRAQNLFDSDGNSEKRAALQKDNAQSSAIQNFFLIQMTQLPFSLTERLEIIEHVTVLGVQSQVDLFLENEVLAKLNGKGLEASAILPLEKILKQRRVLSQNLHLKLAEALLEIDFKRVEARAVRETIDERTVVLLADRIEALIPFSTTKKDQLLESLSLRIRAAEPEILNFLQSMKAISMNKAHPSLVNLGSLFSELSKSMTYEQNFEFLRFLMQPNKKKLPAFCLKAIKNSAQLSEWTEDRALRSLNDLNAMEYLPVFEFLLMQPKFSMLQNPKLAGRILSRLGGMDSKSKDYQWFMAYYASLKPTLKASHVAYQLVQRMDPSGAAERSKFEIFGSMGIVTAQMGATLGWLAKSNQELKDGATPPPISSMMQHLKNTLSPKEFSLIRRPVAILGSASVSTAVEFELVDGRHVVFLVQRPNAREQVQGNAQGMRQFIENMFKTDPTFPRTAALMFVQVAESQILEELNYLNTVKKIHTADEFYSRMNVKLRKELGQFRFYVPGLVTDFEPRPTVLVIEKIEGDTFDKLPANPARHQVGRAIVMSGLESFFFESWFNEDQHVRNFKIDTTKKIPISGGNFYPINVFDFGKSSYALRSSPWASDSQYRFASLLRSLSENNLSASVNGALQMATTENLLRPAPTSLVRDKIIGRAASAFNPANTISDRILSLREAFESQDLIFPDSFYLGRMKGLLMLSREGFLSEKDFDALIPSYVKRAHYQKWPLQIRNATSSICDLLLRGS